MSLLSIEKIQEYLVNKGLQNLPIYYYEETDSTNERAKEFAKNGGTRAVFIAERQTAGRGRMGRRFESDGGVGIYVSFLLFPTIKPSEAARLTVTAAVSLSRAIAECTGTVAKIKWVNDLELSGRKVAGILTEGSARNESTLEYAIVGIGVNVYKRKFSNEISDIATTIEDATGKIISREELIGRLILEMLSERDFSETIAYYKENSSIIGKDVTVFRGDEVFAARAVDVTDGGELTVVLPDGRIENLYCGEVSVRKINPGTPKIS